MGCLFLLGGLAVLLGFIVQGLVQLVMDFAQQFLLPVGQFIAGFGIAELFIDLVEELLVWLELHGHDLQLEIDPIDIEIDVRDAMIFQPPIGLRLLLFLVDIGAQQLF